MHFSNHLWVWWCNRKSLKKYFPSCGLYLSRKKGKIHVINKSILRLPILIYGIKKRKGKKKSSMKKNNLSVGRVVNKMRTVYLWKPHAEKLPESITLVIKLARKKLRTAFLHSWGLDKLETSVLSWNLPNFRNWWDSLIQVFLFVIIRK